MSLDTYLRVLIKRWYIPVLLIGLSVFGAWLFAKSGSTQQAEATVGVPAASFTGFDNVINGQALPERLAERLNDGTTADEIEGMISGGFVKGDRLTPLYKITVTTDDPVRAKLLANLAVEEGMKLFEDNRQAHLDYVLAAFQGQLDEAEAEAAAARDALDRFLAENNAYSLDTRIAAQADLVATLRQQNQFLDVEGSSAAGVEESPELAAARAELDRLLGLQPEHDHLILETTLSQATIDRLDAEAAALRVAGPGYEATLSVVESELADEQAKLATAQQQLTDFETANNAADLDAAVRQQQRAVNEQILADAEAAGVGSAGAQAALTTAEGALEQLQAAQPEYNRLSRALDKAESRLDIREQQESFVVEQTSPLDTLIEIVDPAVVVSSSWWTIIRYAMAVFVSLFVSLTLVYVVAFFERNPPTIEELEQEFGVPVIATVPRVV